MTFREEDSRRDEPPVSDDPSVTIYMDGLMLLSHSERTRLTQAAIHTQAPHHALQIVVFDADGVLLWPRSDADWDGSHRHVKAVEPLWLFVDSGGGTPPPQSNFSSHLHSEGGQSFGLILDFEDDLYHHPLEGFRTDAVARLNMPHGLFYSATHEVSELHSFNQGQNPNQAVFIEDRDLSTLGAADIDSRSTDGADKDIVLWQSNPAKELFRFRLDGDSNYEIHVYNVPLLGSPPMPMHAHFLQYYGLFRLRPGEKKFLLKSKPHSRKLSFVITPDSPPCNIGRRSQAEPL